MGGHPFILMCRMLLLICSRRRTTTILAVLRSDEHCFSTCAITQKNYVLTSLADIVCHTLRSMMTQGGSVGPSFVGSALVPLFVNLFAGFASRNVGTNCCILVLGSASSA